MKLPIEQCREELQQAVTRQQARVLLKAPTGTGKSTTVPLMVQEAGISGMILVVEPRRMAARLLANRVARQQESKPGKEIGYVVKLDSNYGADTRILYMTDGVFRRWLQTNPSLNGVDAVIFDEFHERRLSVDLSLGYCLELQEKDRENLAIVVMSATLETGSLFDFLSQGCGKEEVSLLEVEGRNFPVSIEYLPGQPKRDRSGRMSPPPIWEQVAGACQLAIKQEGCGDILCFLPGAYEIRRTEEILRQSSRMKGWDIFPLHGAMPVAAQEAALEKGDRPKVIVATNIAETSLTIEGVRTVIDSGQARISGFDTRRGIQTLFIEKISRAAAEQRTGRAGRTATGRCYRLWSEAEQHRRSEFELPEILRTDLSDAILFLKSAGVAELRQFRWPDAPPQEAVERAEKLLHHLGALNEGEITEIGREMVDFPLEPRLARLLLAGKRYKCVVEAAFIAAAVQVGTPWAKKEAIESFFYDHDYTDFQAEWRGMEAAEGMKFDTQRVARLGLHGRRSRELYQTFLRLQKMIVPRGGKVDSIDWEKNRDAIGKAMLVSFGDRLAIRNNSNTRSCQVTYGRGGELDVESIVRSDIFLATEMAEVEGREIRVRLRRAMQVEMVWLSELFPKEVGEKIGVAWDKNRRRVVSREQACFRGLVLQQTDRDQGVSLDLAAQELAARVLSGELVLKQWDAKVEQWCIRLACLQEWMPELELPGWSNDDKAMVIQQICHGAVSYKEIKDVAVWPILDQWLSAGQKEVLETFAPSTIKLPKGRQAKLRYELGKSPSMGARVADLFGLWETPHVANHKIPILVHVQAPNQRPWQMTTDMASFWKNGYPLMRKELSGRYPKHPWPENPQEGF